MTKENYVLIIWNESGIVETQGLYPDNEQTFKYVKSLMINHVKEWQDEESLDLPKNPQDQKAFYDWYFEKTESSLDYWQVFTVSPQDAPLI